MPVEIGTVESEIEVAQDGPVTLSPQEFERLVQHVAARLQARERERERRAELNRVLPDLLRREAYE